MPVSGPTVVRRQLGRRLRKLREAAGRTEQEVDDARIMSRTKLWRIETGKAPVKIPDVRTLCWFYKAEEAADALAEMAIGTTEQGWWQDFGDVVPDWFRLYVSLEAAASSLQSYEPELVPGLLQTEDYARAVYRTQPSNGHDVERQVALRMERQERLLGDTPPRMEVVLGEGVLARSVGGDEVMQAQTDRLRRLAALEHVEIRILTWDSGAHASMIGGFSVLDFPDPEDPAFVYLEAQVGGRYLERPSDLETYRRTFKVIYRQAVPIEEYR